MYRSKNARHEFLLVKYESGSYGLIGGGMKKGETKKETAKREIFEETGIKKFIHLKEIPIEYSFFMKDGERKNWAEHKEVHHLFSAEVEENITIEKSREHEELIWAEKRKLAKLLPYKELREVVKKYLSKQI
ncbi:NUDIX domain-containing protein [Candidatus Woesearchaeota archaeon]|nr:NUDIX domain-containing protein [Candidatus Woesearchaeota archaeon]